MTATRRTLGMAETARVIDEVGVPSCPPVLAELVRGAVRPLPDIGKAVRAIEVDSGLADALLLAVNAPLHGLPRKAGSVGEAIAAIGVHGCVNLVADLMLRRMFESIGSPWSRTLWDEIAQRAVIVAYLARELGVARYDEAHTFGLFRHASVPLLMKRYAGYRGAFEQAHGAADADILREEQDRFGIDHARAGAVLARTWRLPERIWCAIQWHHARDFPASASGAMPPARMVAVAVLADSLEHAHRRPDVTPAWAREREFAIRVLGIGTPELAVLRTDVELMLEG